MSAIKVEESQVRKFAAVYAEAVLTHLDSGEEQWLTWDGHSHRFDFIAVSRDPDDAGQLIVLTVNEHWQRQTGDIEEIVDPAHDHYDPEALRGAIEHQLIEERVGQGILQGYLEQLTRIAARLEAALESPPAEDDDASA